MEDTDLEDLRDATAEESRALDEPTESVPTREAIIDAAMAEWMEKHSAPGSRSLPATHRLRQQLPELRDMIIKGLDNAV